MILALCFLAGLCLALVGALVALFRRYEAVHDRLYLAWKDGYQVPPEDVPRETVVDLEAEYTEIERDWLSQWESAEARAKWGRKLLELKRAGKTTAEALVELEQPAWA